MLPKSEAVTVNSNNIKSFEVCQCFSKARREGMRAEEENATASISINLDGSQPDSWALAG